MASMASLKPLTCTGGNERRAENGLRVQSFIIINFWRVGA